MDREILFFGAATVLGSEHIVLKEFRDYGALNQDARRGNRKVRAGDSLDSPAISRVIMLDPKKPIFQRDAAKPAIPSQPKHTTPVSLTPEEIELKKLQHEDGWLHDHKDKAVRLKFMDGEVLEGKVGKVRKFSFALHTATGSIMCFKVAVKFIAEVV
jgi:sRNA-binding regulator protein Hfq